MTYGFDLAGRPTSAASGGTTWVESARYLPFGPMTEIAFGNGTTRTMRYDARYRVLENKLTGPAGMIADYNYAEDASGNITQIHDAVDPTYNRDFAYDDLNRLTSATTGSSLWGSARATSPVASWSATAPPRRINVQKPRCSPSRLRCSGAPTR